MKKGLLFLSALLTAQASFCQLTQSNELAIGTHNMYVVDTTSATLPSIEVLTTITGTGVTWDYSNGVMDASETQGLVVSSVSGNATYPNATKMFSQGTIDQYYHSTASARILDGYIYDAGGMLGVVDVVFSGGLSYITYPFNYGSTVATNFSGNATTGSLPTPVPFNGKIVSKIDGTGTLKLMGQDVPDVFRLSIIDTVSAEVMGISINLIRTQFEYYETANPETPLFLDATIEVVGVNKERQVLSKNLAQVGVNTVNIENFKVFPNPAVDEFTVSGSFSKGNVEVTDMAGRIVFAGEINAGSTVKLTDAKSGIYMVKVSAEGKTAMQKLTVK